MQPFVARASFNLGYMHQFGVGVEADTLMAKRHYHHCLEVDPNGVHVPVSLMLTFLWLQSRLPDQWPSSEAIVDALLGDVRTHVLAILLVALTILCRFRGQLLAQQDAAEARIRAARTPSVSSGARASNTGSLPQAPRRPVSETASSSSAAPGIRPTELPERARAVPEPPPELQPAADRAPESAAGSPPEAAEARVPPGPEAAPEALPVSAQPPSPSSKPDAEAAPHDCDRESGATAPDAPTQML